MDQQERWTSRVSIFASLIFLLIGARFMLTPLDAIDTFGLDDPPAVADLTSVIGLRDLWLALLILGLTICREWRALSFAFGLGVFVCTVDCIIAVRATAWPPAIALHVGAGVLFAVLAWRFHKLAAGSAATRMARSSEST